jgi:O-antigen ligase
MRGGEYLCEHPGLFETHSIVQRVRFRGLLEDPNELCLALSMGAPLALGLYERRRSLRRLLLAIVTFGLVIPCIVMTRSRSGQLSILAALGVYFLRRFGRRGIFLALVLAVPILLLGGRSGAEADSSSDERLECWSEALSMWREYPLLGVGYGQFTDHHYLTAHNSFLLALAELGPAGLLLWTGSLYAAFKTMLRIHFDFMGRPDAAAALDWTYALTASLVGLTVSSVFLSVTYHGVLWIFLGLAAALYAAVRAHAPGWRVRYGLRDVAVVFGIDIAFIGAIWLYLRVKGV